MELVGMRAEPDGKPRPKGRTSDCADEVTLSLKGANSPTRGRKLRLTGTKARARVSNGPNSLVELKKQLEVRTRELAEARGHLSEALERQAATDDVLRVISSSPGDLQSVFETILADATRLCQAKLGMLYLWEGEGQYRVAALHGAPPRLAEERRRGTVVRSAPGSGLGRIAQIKHTGRYSCHRCPASLHSAGDCHIRRSADRTGCAEP